MPGGSMPVTPPTNSTLPRLGLLLWGLWVAVVLLIVRCPASWVLSPLLRHFQVPVQITGGTIWSGSLRWQLADVSVPAQWDCHPDLRLRLACDMRFRLAEQDSRLQLALGWHTWQLYALQAWVPAELIMQEVAGLQLAAPVQVRSLSGRGDYQHPASWQLQGRLDYAGGPTSVQLQAQSYHVVLPPVRMQAQPQAGTLVWTLTTMPGALLARLSLLPGDRYQIELAQRLLALSPLYQGRAWTPDRIDVKIQDHD